jgi:histone-lysine N-methyltransferase SETMAR
LLHRNVSSHKATIVRQYLKQEKVVELPHPPYSPDFAPCEFSYFRGAKNTLLEENIKREKILVWLLSSV